MCCWLVGFVAFFLGWGFWLFGGVVRDFLFVGFFGGRVV